MRGAAEKLCDESKIRKNTDSAGIFAPSYINQLFPFFAKLQKSQAHSAASLKHVHCKSKACCAAKAKVRYSIKA